MNKKNNDDSSKPAKITDPSDLPDSADDDLHMQQEAFSIDLPDVKDIPGQEFLHILPLGELADTTISSDDEEGVGILDDDDEEELIVSTTSNVSKVEKDLLQETAENMPTAEDTNLRSAALDNTDEEGSILNEGSSSKEISGSDLDVPGAEQDDADEEIGEEDEENNDYSLGADKD